METQARSVSLEKVFRWLKSPGGITVCVTSLIAILAGIDKGPYVIINIVVVGGIWALMAIGVALIFGVMNIPNFAHGEFFMIGSLVAYFIITPLKSYLEENSHALLTIFSPLIAIFGAAIVVALIGVFVERLCFYPLRKRSKNWLLDCFLVTIGIGVVLINGHQMIFGADFKGVPRYWDVSPISIFGVYVSVDRFVAFCLAMITILVFWIFMKFSKMGQSIRAVSQDETGAGMVGISVDTVHIITFGLSCGLAGLAGASLLFMFPSYPTSGLIPLYNSFFIILMVGFGNVAAAVPGSFIVALFQVLTRVYVGEGWDSVIPMFMISAVLVFKPNGLFGSKVSTIWEQ